jgi:hypothetical protein
VWLFPKTMIMYRFLSIELCRFLRNNHKRLLWTGVLLISLTGCKTDYEKLVDRELKKGIRKDSIFLGINLRMSSKDFYAHCWELNKQKIIRQGSTNVSVLWDVTDLKDTADMNFYPTFYNDSIYEMPAFIQYKGWAPWNKHLSNDSLLLDVVNMLKKWYGGDFIRIDFPDVGTVYVKVDGNRRIMVSKFEEAKVKIIYTDLLAEKRKEDEPTDE